jgi:hypothetical protein
MQCVEEFVMSTDAILLRYEEFVTSNQPALETTVLL